MPVTYASLANASSDYEKQLRYGITAAHATLGQRHPVIIDGKDADEQAFWHNEASPLDDRLHIGQFGWATVEHTLQAMQVAHDAFPDWSATQASERISILRRTADRLERDRFRLAGQIVLEAGKTPAEALAEADEAPVFLRLYCDDFERANGFEVTMPSGEPNVTNVSVMRPYGTWAVISPLNFPLALATGPTAAALVTGNTVVLKPSPAAQLMAVTLRDALLAEGLPPNVLTVLAGGAEVGAAITQSALLGGVTFTGSYAVGSAIAKNLAPHSKPVIAEMGGKNPAIVGASANLDQAVEGVLRSAFGYSGQKCSACSRVFVHESRYDEFKKRVVAKTASLRVGNTSLGEFDTGPLTNAAAVDRFLATLQEVRNGGGEVLAGGEHLTTGDLQHGNYVSPAVVEAPATARVWHDELFAPILAIRPVATFEDALSAANDSEYGLTAGLYSGEQSEVDAFLARSEASVLYVNRRSGATTGAWPGQQPISGWKQSGNTGRGTAGPHYLQQYLREQSRTVVAE